MNSVKYVNSQLFNQKLKEKLKEIKEIKPVGWINFVKSSSNRARPPEQPDFWYVRSASILRRICLEGEVGVERLRSYYGGRKKLKYRPEFFRKSGGNIIRKVIQQLEKAGFVEKGKKGRKITPKGQKFLNSVAKEVGRSG